MTASDQSIVLGMGCFWGAEKRMAAIPGVIDVESGYANGEIAGDYESVLHHERLLQRGLSGKRNHAEVVKVRFDPARVGLETILARFWESHDPTQGDRQGNDVGSNYRSAVYTVSETQLAAARASRNIYQTALTRAGHGAITTEIAPLTAYFSAEAYHQDYLEKNPHGYCGLGGTGVAYPQSAAETDRPSGGRQLVVFVADDAACRRLEADVLDLWRSDVPLLRIEGRQAPAGLTLREPVGAAATAVYFVNGAEVSRFSGYDGEPQTFWRWWGQQTLSPEQRRIAFQQGTERPFSGAHLGEKRAGRFVDPLSGAPLFRSETKFESGCGWPSFFRPVEGALSFHADDSHGMRRVEVRSASSGIHLGHVFDDGPAPTGQRYCINGNVLRFVPDEE